MKGGTHGKWEIKECDSTTALIVDRKWNNKIKIKI